MQLIATMSTTSVTVGARQTVSNVKKIINSKQDILKTPFDEYKSAVSRAQVTCFSELLESGFKNYSVNKFKF